MEFTLSFVSKSHRYHVLSLRKARRDTCGTDVRSYTAEWTEVRKNIIIVRHHIASYASVTMQN